ncbi:hypothetical protein OH492_27295 [Vibrio chagasii]|nr:hypothetical protein [Vibrio chagasii]
MAAEGKKRITYMDLEQGQQLTVVTYIGGTGDADSYLLPSGIKLTLSTWTADLPIGQQRDLYGECHPKRQDIT